MSEEWREEKEGKKRGGEGWKKIVKEGKKGGGKYEVFFIMFQLLYLYDLKCLMSCLKVALNGLLSLDLLLQLSNVLVFTLIQTIQNSLVRVCRG